MVAKLVSQRIQRNLVDSKVLLFARGGIYHACVYKGNRKYLYRNLKAHKLYGAKKLAIKLRIFMIRKFKHIFLLIFCLIVDLFVKKTDSYNKNTLLLIRIDAIGDYVLFRNFIEIVRKSEKYNSHKITLLANVVWKDLAVALDSQFIDEFIFLDRQKFSYNFIYRYKFLKKLFSKGYEVVLNPTYSREFYYGDWIVKGIFAKDKIGSIGDLSNNSLWQKNISDKWYTNLIPARDEIIFEFYRNREFFENLFRLSLNIAAPFMDSFDIKWKSNGLENYAILFLGARQKYRKWPVANFVKVAEHLKKSYRLNIVICGGKFDIDEANEFKKNYQGEFSNCMGTSLNQLLELIANSSLIISNETSAPHLGVALDTTKIIVVSNGNHFGRFTPYPKEMSDKYSVIYHPEIERNLDNYKILSNKYGYGSSLDIKEISVDSVIKKIDELYRD